MRFFYNNLIDGSGVVFTASSEASDLLGGENIAHEFRSKPWRTGTSSAPETIVIDLGSAQAVTSVILLDHTLTSGDSAIALEGNTADSWGAPAFSQALTWVSGTIAQTFSTQTYRYWRIKFTKSSAAEARSIGRVFLGPYLQPTDIPDYDGYSRKKVDPSRKSKSRAGQTWAEPKAKYCEIDLDLSRFTQTDIDNLETLFDTVGQSKNFFVQVQTSGLDDYWYVKFSRDFAASIAGYDGAFLWDLKLEMEEQL